MTASALRVIKIGGSLFTFSGLVPTFQSWLGAQPAAVNILVAGGGSLADVVRDAERRFSLGDATCHWLCVDLLDVSARLLAGLLPTSRFAVTLDDLNRMLSVEGGAVPIVFCPGHFLRHDEPRMDGPSLPHNWNVTSDSIAARLAEVLAADELVLLKSADPPSSLAADPEYVDGHFFQASHGLGAVRFVNLRRFTRTREGSNRGANGSSAS